MGKVRIHHPELSVEEREARMNEIKKATKRFYQEIWKARSK